MTKRRLGAAAAFCMTAAIVACAGCGPFRHPSSDGVDQLFAEWNRPDSPGCGVGVSRNGVVLYEHGYGMANLESGAAITPASVFHVASISKQFTAMSILLLEKSGRLSLDDEVRQYIPDWTDRESHLTIRHLLSHTGGVRDGFALLALAAPRDEDVNEAVVRMVAHQRALNFAPGAEFDYSNSGYVVLGEIVKRASGQSLRAFEDANIFKPLGMTHTHVHDDPAMIMPNRAWGYSKNADGLRAAVHADLGHLVGTTGLFTTARDLLRWEQNFVDVRVGDPALLAAMQTPVMPTGWTDGSSYAFGLEIGEYRGLKTVAHAGGDPGFAAYAVRYPDHGLAVALLCNLDTIGPKIKELSERVADIYLADRFKEPVPSPAAAPARGPLPAEQMAGKIGLYRDSVNGQYGRVFARDGALRVSVTSRPEGDSFELTPLDTNRFLIQGTPVVVEFAPGGEVQALEIHVTGGGSKPEVSRRVDETSAPSSADLRALEGRYISPDLGVTCTVVSRESGLAIAIPGRTDMVVQPIVRDVFSGDRVGVIEFSRDARGAVTGFLLHKIGVRSLPFDRVKP